MHLEKGQWTIKSCWTTIKKLQNEFFKLSFVNFEP